jgi:heptosyltransferase-2/heptosyltransferase-3
MMKRRLRLLFLHILAVLARPFARRPPADLRSVLYIKPDHLGDLLLATPALAALRRRVPGVQISAMVGPWSEIILRRNPDVDLVLICPFPGFERQPKHDGGWRTNDGFASLVIHRLSSLAMPYRTLIHYALLLRAARYDLAIVGRDDHWWGAALALLAGIPLRVGFAVPECRPFLTTALPWNPRAHVATQGLALIEALAAGSPPTAELGAPPPNGQAQFATRFDPSFEDMHWADEWLRAHGFQNGEPLVVVHPGTGGPAKLWFADRWAALSSRLVKTGARLVLTGGPGEQALVEAVAAQMHERPPMLAGQTTFGQLAALLRRAALVLGVDSGPLHLAAAQGVPTVHLYGPGDAGRFGPWGDPARHVVMRAELWCSPCGVFGACPRGLARPECMEQIDVELVLVQARQLLGHRAKHE